MVDQADVLTRVAALAKQSDTLHPDWRFDLFTQGDIVGTVLVAKHPHAAERSPINITMGAKFTTGQDELRRKFDRVIGFGTPERLDLPATVVTNFAVDGPEFIKHSGDDVEVTFLPVESESVGKSFAVEMHDQNRKVTATYTGKTLWTGGAHLGVSLKAEFYNVAALEFLLPFEKADGVSVTASVNLAGREPADIVKAVSMLERIDSEHGAKLIFDGDRVASLLLDSQGKSMLGEHRDDILLHKDIAADLVYVQEQTEQYFAYPEEVSVADRIYLRVLRRLLEGRCVVLPDKNQVSATLSSEGSEDARLILGGEAVSLLIDQENFGVEVFGQNFFLGHCRIYAPKVRAVGANGLLKSLGDGDAVGRQVTLRTDENTGFWAFSMERVIEDFDGGARPSSLGLADYPDAPDVAAAAGMSA